MKIETFRGYYLFINNKIELEINISTYYI